MASTTLPLLLTSRDWSILQALEYCPLTVAQLLAVSAVFPQPFPGAHKVCARMRQLTERGYVRRYQYATAGRNAPNYYTLSPLGYRILHGPETAFPSARAFAAVGLARQHHTRCLADFLVHTLVAAHRAGITVANVHRENALKLELDAECLYPDQAFELRTPAGASLWFFLEVDNGTEPVCSGKERDSWERKLRFYDRYQDTQPEHRFRVLAASTCRPERITHILQTAAAMARNPQRSLVYGIGLADYLACPEPLTTPCFLDHRGQDVALVPPYHSSPVARAPLATVEHYAAV